MEEESPEAGTENPHVLWRQLSGFVFWGGACSIVGGVYFGPLLFLTGALTFADAWRSGIFKRREKPVSFSLSTALNLSPMGWAVAMCALLILAYPAYLWKRNSLKTQESSAALFYLVIVLGGAILLNAVFNVF